MEVGKAVKVVTEFLPNREDKQATACEEWYAKALDFMKAHPGQWVMVDQEYGFHRSDLHKLKFERFNQGSRIDRESGYYKTEFRYPEDGSCVMYGMWIKPAVSEVKERVKRWFK